MGRSVSMPADGLSFLVGASLEASGSVEIDGDATDRSVNGSGAAYVFRFGVRPPWCEMQSPQGGDDALGCGCMGFFVRCANLSAWQRGSFDS